MIGVSGGQGKELELRLGNPHVQRYKDVRQHADLRVAPIRALRMRSDKVRTDGHARSRSLAFVLQQPE